MKGFLDSFFKLKERDTDWRREVVGGDYGLCYHGLYYFRQSADHVGGRHGSGYGNAGYLSGVSRRHAADGSVC